MTFRDIARRIAIIFLAQTLGSIAFLEPCLASKKLSSKKCENALVGFLREMDHFPKNVAIKLKGVDRTRGLQIMGILSRHEAPFIVRANVPNRKKPLSGIFADFDFSSTPPTIRIEGDKQTLRYNQIFEIEPLKTVTDKHWRIKDFIIAIRESAWRSDDDGKHPWIGFKTSDPKHHDPADFIYFVHAIKPNRDRSYDKVLDYFLMKPTISTSLIFSRHADTFWATGFILDIPPENIISVTVTDGSTDVFDENTTKQQYLESVQATRKIWGIAAPEQIMHLSPAHEAFNEIYAKTGFKFEPAESRKVGIKGIFVRPTASAAALEWARKTSATLDVPLVSIH